MLECVLCFRMPFFGGFSLQYVLFQNHGLGHLPQPDNFTTVGNNLGIEINQYNCPIEVTKYTFLLMTKYIAWNKIINLPKSKTINQSVT